MRFKDLLSDIRKRDFSAIKTFFKEMNFMRFSTKNILLMRFIIGNFSIILFAVIILAGISVSKISQVIRTNTDTFSQNQLHTISNTVDYSMNDMFRTMRSMSISSDNSDVFTFNNWSFGSKNSIAFYNWMTFFKDYIANYDYIQSVWVLNSNNVIIDSNAGISLPNEYEYWSFFSDVIKKAASEYTFMVPYVSQPHMVDNTEVISLVSPLKLADASFSSGTVIMNIKTRYLAQNLGYAQLGSNYISFIYNKNENSVISASQLRYDRDGVCTAAANLLSDNSDNTPRINGKKYTAYIQHSTIVPDWYFLTMYDNSYANAQKRSVYLWYAFAIVMLVLFCLCSAWFITFYIYKPLQRIISNLSLNLDDMPNLNFDNKKNDEIEIITSHISTLESELSEKNKFIHENFAKIRDITLRNLLENSSDPTSDPSATLAKCGIIFTDNNFYAAMFTIDKYMEVLSDYTAKDAKALSDKIFNNIYNTLTQSENATGIYWNRNKYIFILNTAKTMSASDIARLYHRVNENLAPVCRFTVSLCLSAPVSALSELHSAFEQVNAQEKHLFSLGYEAIIMCPYTKYYATDDSAAIGSIISNITHSLPSKNSSQLLSELDSLSEILRWEDPDDIRKNIFKLLDTIEKNLRSALPNYDFNIIYKQLDNFFAFSVFSELQEFLISKMMEISSACKSMSEQNIAQRIKDYIDLYYYNDISLDTLSEYFHVSSSYISKSFAEAYGVGFQNYLSELRISKAKELLKNTDLSIQTIGTKVGFMSYNSFSRTFKRATGISAKMYRTNPSQADENNL